MTNFREKGQWAYPGTPQFLGIPPIMSGMGKATDFKFGVYVHRVNPNKSPLKTFEERERGHIQGLPKFFWVPLLSQEREKLRTSNFACTFIGSIGTKALKNFGKSNHGHSHGVPNFFTEPGTLGASRGHLSDSLAFLFYDMFVVLLGIDEYSFCACKVT